MLRIACGSELPGRFDASVIVPPGWAAHPACKGGKTADTGRVYECTGVLGAADAVTSCLVQVVITSHRRSRCGMHRGPRGSGVGQCTEVRSASRSCVARPGRRRTWLPYMSLEERPRQPRVAALANRPGMRSCRIRYQPPTQVPYMSAAGPERHGGGFRRSIQRGPVGATGR